MAQTATSWRAPWGNKEGGNQELLLAEDDYLRSRLLPQEWRRDALQRGRLQSKPCSSGLNTCCPQDRDPQAQNRHSCYGG